MKCVSQDLGVIIPFAAREPQLLQPVKRLNGALGIVDAPLDKRGADTARVVSCATGTGTTGTNADCCVVHKCWGTEQCVGPKSVGIRLR